MSKQDYADRRVETVSSMATVASVTGVALTFFCLVLVRLLNSALFADNSINLSIAQGDGVNVDLLTLGAFLALFLAVSLLPAVLVPGRVLLRILRIGVPLAALAVVVYGLLQVGLPYLYGGSPNYLSHFYTLVGGWSLAGSWLVSLARVRSL